jgi:hypothetical protein
MGAAESINDKNLNYVDKLVSHDELFNIVKDLP